MGFNGVENGGGNTEDEESMSDIFDKEWELPQPYEKSLISLICLGCIQNVTSHHIHQIDKLAPRMNTFRIDSALLASRLLSLPSHQKGSKP